MLLSVVEVVAVAVALVPAAEIGPVELVGFPPPVVKTTFPEVGIGC